MIHNHEVPSSILGPATKKQPFEVAFFVYYVRFFKLFMKQFL